MPPTPHLDRLVGLIAWLTDRLAGTADQAGGKPAGGSRAGNAQAAGDPAPLDPTRATTVLARLRDIVARFCAVAATPIPPPKPAPKPPEPHFIPTHTLVDHPAEAEPASPAPLGLPSTYRGLLRVAPHLIPGRDLLEDILRDPTTQAMLDADYRLGPILRPLAWMLGVDRKLLPASSRRPRPAVVVCGGRTEVAAAVAEYTAARAEVGFDIRTLCYTKPWKYRHRRAVWRGKHGYVLRDGVDLWG